jgi:hypothetical protein
MCGAAVSDVEIHTDPVGGEAGLSVVRGLIHQVDDFEARRPDRGVGLDSSPAEGIIVHMRRFR